MRDDLIIFLVSCNNEEKLGLTVISGVLIFILGQIFRGFVQKPLEDFNDIRKEISYKIKFYENILTNSDVSPKKEREARKEMRELASQLESRYLIIPLKTVCVLLGFLKTKKQVIEANKNLIFLSNAGGVKGKELKNQESINKLKEELNIVL